MAQGPLTIATPDGPCPARLFAPERPARTAILFFMDAFGPRPALFAMAERMAALGHAVLLPDLFHRFGAYGRFDAKTAFATPETATVLRRMLGETTQAMTIADTGAFLDALAAEGFNGPVAAVGYCMGGARALNAAAHHPGRIAAAASFHGGNLASDKDDSPHRAANRIKGKVMVGVAGVDASFPPAQSALLAQALREAEVDHVIENHVGMEHGWCVPDHRVFNAAGAERHWKRLTVFLDETLGGG